MSQILNNDRLGFILGTGWSDPDVLQEQGFICEYVYDFKKYGIDVGGGAGHPNRFLFGTWHGQNVVISQGRVHLYQEIPARDFSMLRLWMSVMIGFLGNDSRIIITSSVGGLTRGIKTGMLVQPTHLISAHLSQPYLNGNKGEFCMSEHLLWISKEESKDPSGRRQLFYNAADASILKPFRGDWQSFRRCGNATQIIIPGPGFGGAFERSLWESWGCHTVGMSIDPELRLIALENQRRLVANDGSSQISPFVATIVTDDHDLPDHVEIQVAAKLRAPQLGKFLSHIVQHWRTFSQP